MGEGRRLCQYVRRRDERQIGFHPSSLSPHFYFSSFIFSFLFLYSILHPPSCYIFGELVGLFQKFKAQDLPCRLSHSCTILDSEPSTQLATFIMVAKFHNIDRIANIAWIRDKNRLATKQGWFTKFEKRSQQHRPGEEESLAGTDGCHPKTIDHIVPEFYHFQVLSAASLDHQQNHKAWKMQQLVSMAGIPDSKIFVAKTFRIKRVNRVNFQIHDKCA